MMSGSRITSFATRLIQTPFSRLREAARGVCVCVQDHPNGGIPGVCLLIISLSRTCFISKRAVEMSALAVSSSPSSSFSAASICLRSNIFGRPLYHAHPCSPSSCKCKPASSLPIVMRVLNDSKGSNVSSDPTIELSEADKLVNGMDFGELCNDFECISSPAVESTARQLVRDILELREGNRALGIFSFSVKYKDPVRTFIGREKYKRPLWVTDVLHDPLVTVQEMVMLSTSVLNIKWTVKGKPKFLTISSIGGDLIIMVNSRFTLNQISGQVIEHEESWDLSASSAIGRAYFWTSRQVFAAVESGKDIADAFKDTARFSNKKERDIYPDPSGDPTKFFQRDDGLQRDAYQIALFLAVIYFVVQFLRTTL